MQVHATGDYSPAIIIDADSLKRLWGHVESFADKCLATVSCSDGVERKFEKIDELLGYENPVRSAARTFELYGRTIDSGRVITITVGRRFGASASVSIRGEEQDVTAVKTRVMDTFAGMRAWYSPAATVDLHLVWTGVFMTFMLILVLMSPSAQSERPGKSFSEAVSALGEVVLVLAAVISVIVGTSKLRARYFPLVSVVLGHSVRRYATDEKVRWGVIVSLLVGLTGSAISALLSGGVS